MEKKTQREQLDLGVICASNVVESPLSLILRRFGELEPNAGQETRVSAQEKVGEPLLPFGLPRITPEGTLVIPANCAPRYRYWQDGQCLDETLVELGASEEVRRRYVEAPYVERTSATGPDDSHISSSRSS